MSNVLFYLFMLSLHIYYTAIDMTYFRPKILSDMLL